MMHDMMMNGGMMWGMACFDEPHHLLQSRQTWRVTAAMVRDQTGG
jgi:hypothetical protein